LTPADIVGLARRAQRRYGFTLFNIKRGIFAADDKAEAIPAPAQHARVVGSP
jgi:hypothetical protein